MRHSLWLFLLVTCISNSVARGQGKDSHHLDTSTYVILKYRPRVITKRGLSGDFYFNDTAHQLRPTTLSTSEVDGIEPLVDSAYQYLVKELPANYSSLHPLSVYKRQYVAVINSKSQKEVWIHFFCDVPEGWRKSEIIIQDGGACYLCLWINITLRKASKLFDNGVA
ncbi:MAG TPA: hypothetical protein VFE32_20830 [Puia sp.]|nr:hypothetical protein [Puia sp.]